MMSLINDPTRFVPSFFVRWCAAILLVSFSCSQLASANDVHYLLDFSKAKNHYVEVTATFNTETKKELEIYMPVWTPGSYLIREYSRNIEEIRASGQSGKKLEIRKTKKNRWTVQFENEKTVAVQYRLYCREMSVRTNWVEDQFAILNGAPTFLTEVNSRDLPHHVEFKLNKGWKGVATALEQDSENKLLYHAPNFDYLVDSPMLIGNPSVEKFKVGEIEHQLVNLNGDGLWDFEKAASDVAKLVKVHQEIWGVIPYKHYKFLNAIVEAGGGLEHDNSTLMMTSRWSFGSRSRYISWLSLVSHEFFHTWNVRRLRPVELVEYDYENENYFKTLWIAEGITSYYDDLAVRRAGLSTEKEYLDQLSRQIRSLQTTAGRLTQPLSESSYDTWIKYYRPDENSRNSQISYYTKGAVAAFLLDAEIRNASKGAKCLDDVLKALYKKYSGPKGYTSQQFRTLASEIAGKDLSAWFKKAIDSTDELDYTTALETYGLQFRKSTSNQPLWTGLTLSGSSGAVTVTAVVRDSPGFKAGINVGDEVISIGGYRVTSSDLASRLKAFKEGQSKEVLLTRRGRILKRTLKMEKKPAASWSLSSISELNAIQKMNREKWLTGVSIIED